jgi:hypothetical protein
MSQKPTAAQILHSWDKTHPLLIKTSLWIVLLRIAATGTEGITLTELTHRNGTVPYRDSLKKFVTVERSLPTRCEICSCVNPHSSIKRL